MNKNKMLVVIIIIAVCTFYFFLYRIDTNTQYVNVYGWYGIIPRNVIDDFEKETGVKVRYDLYDNNETLEAKLLATNNGYDVVFPSLIPYATRQCSIGVYQNLDPNIVINIKNIDESMKQKFTAVLGDMNKLVPFFWGSIGIAYNEETIKSVFHDKVLDSYEFVFDKRYISMYGKYGVSFPEEFIDIFPNIMHYLKLNPIDKSLNNVSAAVSVCKKIRPYIRKFSSTTLINDLLMGTVCVAIGSSDNAWRAIQTGKEVGKKIKFFVPKEGSTLWIDCMGIPSGAPNPENANKFINFMLRKDIAARITNYSGILTAIGGIQDHLSSSITVDSNIFPSQEVMERLHIGKANFSKKDMEYERFAIRAWNNVKLNIFEEKQ